jgi:hypothetical protein
VETGLSAEPRAWRAPGSRGRSAWRPGTPRARAAGRGRALARRGVGSPRGVVRRRRTPHEHQPFGAVEAGEGIPFDRGGLAPQRLARTHLARGPNHAGSALAQLVSLVAEQVGPRRQRRGALDGGRRSAGEARGWRMAALGKLAFEGGQLASQIVGFRHALTQIIILPHPPITAFEGGDLRGLAIELGAQVGACGQKAGVFGRGRPRQPDCRGVGQERCRQGGVGDRRRQQRSRQHQRPDHCPRPSRCPRPQHVAWTAQASTTPARKGQAAALCRPSGVTSGPRSLSFPRPGRGNSPAQRGRPKATGSAI